MFQARVENASCWFSPHAVVATRAAACKRRTRRCCTHMLIRWRLSSQLPCCIMKQEVQLPKQR